MKVLGKAFLSIFTLVLIAAGCAQQQDQSAETAQQETDFTKAVAVIHPTEGNDISGTVTFTEDTAGVTIEATASGFESMTKHGFHIHQYGDCTADDATSAGGHYAPDGNEHGEPGPYTHDGDLGNMVANEDGNASLTMTSKDITLNGPKSIIGRGIIVHANADDLESQPSGAAGPRIGCGVIGIANTSSGN